MFAVQMDRNTTEDNAMCDDTMTYDDWESLADDQGNAIDLATTIWALENKIEGCRNIIDSSTPVPADKYADWEKAMALEHETMDELNEKLGVLEDEFERRFGFPLRDLQVLDEDDA